MPLQGCRQSHFTRRMIPRSLHNEELGGEQIRIGCRWRKRTSLQSAHGADPHMLGRCKSCWWAAFPTRPQHVQAARSTSVCSRQVSVDIYKSFVILSRTTDSCDTGRSRKTYQQPSPGAERNDKKCLPGGQVTGHYEPIT
jgi:hypothetical protein